MTTYRLPDGTIPVLVSSSTAELVSEEAAAVLRYATNHPEVAPQPIADMLFRTRVARPHRALAMVTGRDELLAACEAIVDGREHASVLRTTAPAAARRPAYVFPGQGGQRPGMGRIFYDTVPAFRLEVDRCVEAFVNQIGVSPLDYLRDEYLSVHDTANVVQPALFTQMAGLAAMWRSFGITPDITIGHSQGEIAAAYVSGAVTLADAVRVVGIRADAADGLVGDYAMAVVAADRDTCETILARCSGWAELSVVNSPGMTGISGQRETVQGIVDALTEQGTFARVIRVHYPAHTSAINALHDTVRPALQHQLQHPAFLDASTPCLGATLGAPLAPDLPVDQYWFWNLRNTVRFDKAIAAALPLGIDTFVELAEHPTLQLAIDENLAAAGGDALAVGTSNRASTDLAAFTRNLALLAVNDLDYPWERLGTESGGPPPLPLPDFPNLAMNQVLLWLPYDGGAAPPAPAPATEPVAGSDAPRLLTEQWIRLSHRSLVPPRTIGVVDHSGACADLAAALCGAAAGMGATARLIAAADPAAADLDSYVILVPPSPDHDAEAAAAAVSAFFGERAWWPPITDRVTDCWLVTVGGESVLDDDAAPDLVAAAAAAGFRSVGTEFQGVGFRHLDLPAGSSAESAGTILAALHTKDESELALREGILYAKRIADSTVSADADTVPGHVLITGGTGHLGLEFCEHFARRGARRITLLSRSGETAAVADRLRRIRSTTSTQIDAVRCDVGDPAAISRLTEQLRDAPADLIIHAALAYSDIEFSNITVEDADGVLRAKVVGMGRILAAVPRADHCRVVLCSSAAATIGGRGQIMYAAANRMLDAMAHRLRAQGLDCVSIQWGQWAVHALDATGAAKVAATGMLPMLPADALAAGMPRFRDNVVVTAFDLTRMRSVLSAYGYGPLLSELDSPAVDPGVPIATPGTDVKHRLMSLLAGAIGVEAVDGIDTTAPMVAIGLDSLQALEFHRRVKTEFNYELEVADLLGGASIADVLVQLDSSSQGAR